MPLFIKESFIYKLFNNYFIKPYNQSLLKKNIKKIIDCFKNSLLYKNVENYLNKKPYFLNSLVYKFFRKIVNVIDRIMDFLHKTIKKWFLGSNTFFELRSIKYSKKEKNLLLCGILIGALNIGYTATSLFLNNLNIYVCLGLLVITIILFLLGKNINCYRQSFIYKIFKSW